LIRRNKNVSLEAYIDIDYASSIVDIEDWLPVIALSLVEIW